jgi:hypothetical protein
MWQRIKLWVKWWYWALTGMKTVSRDPIYTPPSHSHKITCGQRSVTVAMSRCQKCNGTGWVPDPKYVTTPCLECSGNGIEDCCHGHEGQPEEEMNSGRINTREGG